MRIALAPNAGFPQATGQIAQRGGTNDPANARPAPREAPHVHVKGGGRDAEIWVEPEGLIAESYGFNSRELARIVAVVAENRDLILRAWHEHFGNGGPL
jgi:hypothetical protein